MPTSALVTSRRLGPAIWRESQPAPATRSNSSPAATPMMSRSRKTAPGLSMVVVSSMTAAQHRGRDVNRRREPLPGTFRALHTFPLAGGELSRAFPLPDSGDKAVAHLLSIFAIARQLLRQRPLLHHRARRQHDDQYRRDGEAVPGAEQQGRADEEQQGARI